MEPINIIGAGARRERGGMAGGEPRGAGAAHEMKPSKYSPAHHSPGFAELVCSNSLRSNMLANAVGVLKEEMRLLGSLVIEAAYASEVPAGSALAVDRDPLFRFHHRKAQKSSAGRRHRGRGHGDPGTG